MQGSAVKAMITDAGLRVWEVAEQFGLSANHFSVRLRHDFSDEETDRIKAIIKDLTKEKTPANRG